jgi:two-component system phosphate regulon sensor histidine kinase PhoR
MENHADRPEILAAREGRREATRRYSQTIHAEMLYLAVPLEKEGAQLGILRAALPVTVFEERLAPLRNGIILAAILLFALAAAAAWQISRGLNQPLLAMREWAARLAAGQPAGRLEPAGFSVAADLVIALERMATEFTGRIDRISRQHRELEAVFGSMVEGVVTVDAEERIQSLNPAALALLGLDPGKVRGRGSLEAVRNLELQRFIKKTLSASTTEEGEITLADPKGADRSFYLRGVPLRDPMDRPPARSSCWATSPTCGAWRRCAATLSPTSPTS